MNDLISFINCEEFSNVHNSDRNSNASQSNHLCTMHENIARSRLFHKTAKHRSKLKIDYFRELIQELDLNEHVKIVTHRLRNRGEHWGHVLTQDFAMNKEVTQADEILVLPVK